MTAIPVNELDQAAGERPVIVTREPQLKLTRGSRRITPPTRIIRNRRYDSAHKGFNVLRGVGRCCVIIDRIRVGLLGALSGRGTFLAQWLNGRVKTGRAA